MLYSQEKSVRDIISFTCKVLTSEDLKRLYWVSGSTCAGKTTISSAVADRLKWNVYHCDEHEDQHRKRADPKRQPNWSSYSKLTGDALWMQPVEEHLLLEARAVREQFELIIQDLADQLKRSTRPLLYDGFVSPEILTSILPTKSHAFYLVASEEFQRHYYDRRSWIKDVLSKTSDPAQAWQNWMTRDVAGARILETTLGQFGLEWMTVDGMVSLEDTVMRVCEHFEKDLGK